MTHPQSASTRFLMSVTLTVSDGIVYFDKIMPILPLLSMARVRTTYSKYHTLVLSSKITSYVGRSCMPRVVNGNKTEDMQHFHANNSQIFPEIPYNIQTTVITAFQVPCLTTIIQFSGIKFLAVQRNRN